MTNDGRIAPDVHGGFAGIDPRKPKRVPERSVSLVIADSSLVIHSSFWFGHSGFRVIGPPPLVSLLTSPPSPLHSATLNGLSRRAALAFSLRTGTAWNCFSRDEARDA